MRSRAHPVARVEKKWRDEMCTAVMSVLVKGSR
jgi:hypothetical protein